MAWKCDIVVFVLLNDVAGVHTTQMDLKFDAYTSTESNANLACDAAPVEPRDFPFFLLCLQQFRGSNWFRYSGVSRPPLPERVDGVSIIR